MSYPFFNLRGQEVTLMIALHSVNAIVFVDVIVGKEIQHILLLMQNLLSSRQFNATICTVFEYLERLIKTIGLFIYLLIYSAMIALPIDVIIIFVYFHL